MPAGSREAPAVPFAPSLAPLKSGANLLVLQRLFSQALGLQLPQRFLLAERRLLLLQHLLPQVLHLLCH